MGVVALSEDAAKNGSRRELVPRAALDAVSGAVAGGVARVFVSPLDVIKIRFQVQIEPVQQSFRKAIASTAARSKYTGLVQAAKEILREEGIVGFWRGTVPGLLLVMPYTAIQFVVLHRCKSILASSTKEEDHRKLKGELSFAVGAVAGVAATVGSYPFDLLRTVLASQGEPKVYNGMVAAARGIVSERGVPGLFAGLSPTIAEIIPYAGLQVGLYDAFKRNVSKWNQRRRQSTLEAQLQLPQNQHPSLFVRDLSASARLTALQQFLCGLAAGTLAKVVCHPLDVVKKRFQVEGLVRDARYGARVEVHAYNGMIDAVWKIAKTEGWPALYKGILPSVMKAAPAAAITFFVYELVSRHLERINLEYAAKNAELLRDI